MRIGGWHIDGFGIFHDFRLSLSPGLTVFLGPNEAGKSTLLGFVRAALFGFPNRRSRSAQYPPLAGGRHGGRLTLCGPGEEILVERAGGRKGGVRLNGREATDQELRELLGGADENVFCSVFAFSLAEMQSFEWLHADQIRERIFSAGIAGAGASARKVIETLETDAASILRPRGAARVRYLEERIAQAEQKLKLAQAEAERFVLLTAELEKWRQKLNALSAEEADLRSRQRDLEKMIAARSDTGRAREELAALETIDEFPREPESRLAAFAGRVEAAAILVQRLEEEHSARQRMRAQLQIDEVAHRICDHAEEFHGRLALHRDRMETLANLLERRTLDVVWRGLGMCIAFLAGWLVGRTELVAGVALLVTDLLAAGFLLYQRNARVASLEREIAGWQIPVRGWLASTSSGERLIAEFVSARAACHRSREIRAKAASLDEALGESQARLDAARSERESAAGALQAFLQECGARDEAGFQARLRTFRKRQELSTIIEEREARGADPGGSSQEWTNELAHLNQRLAEVQRQRDQAVEQKGVADAEARRIAESCAAPTIQAELDCLRSEAAAAVREWRIATLAKELVARTLQNFISTRQPAVLEEASSSFARVTYGAYQRILQTEDRESLIVLDRSGQYKRPEELSRGTAEQLYLCLRLGLATEFARRSVSLPLIMDDVLVNFDPARARAVAQELAAFSSRHQVLIFTCHPATAALFAEVAPESKLIGIERDGVFSAGGVRSQTR